MESSVCLSVARGERGKGLVARARGVAQGGVLEMRKYRVRKQELVLSILGIFFDRISLLALVLFQKNPMI